VAQAHRLGESYIFLDVAENALGGRFEIRLDDLNKTFALDANGDGEISDQEYDVRSAEVQRYAESRLRFYHNEREHPVRVVASRAHDYGIAKFALIEFEVPTLKPVPQQLEVEYDYLFDGFESSHRGLLVIENNPRTGAVKNETDVSLIFGPGEQRQLLHLDATPWKKVLHDFVKHGIWHIWIGFDHILFLLALLLPSVLWRTRDGWCHAMSFRRVALDICAVVTAFTLAHSITLSAAALGWVSLPTRWVETAIALTVLLAALNNLWPVVHGRRWLLAFALGLIHGFGFAAVLADLFHTCRAGPEPARLACAGSAHHKFQNLREQGEAGAYKQRRLAEHEFFRLQPLDDRRGQHHEPVTGHSEQDAGPEHEVQQRQ
jgi:hypothetical protein